MTNPDLKFYIEKCISAGMDSEHIFKTLTETGWEEKDVREALTEINKTTTPLASVATTKEENISENSDAITVISQTNQTELGKPIFETQPPEDLARPPRKNWAKKAIITLALLILVSGGGALAYFVTPKIFNSSSNEDVLAKFAANIGEIKSSNYSVKISIKSEPRDAGAQPLDLQFPELKENQPLYDRDTERLRHLESIQFEVTNAFYKDRKYPTTYESESYNGVSLIDPLTKKVYDYKPTSDGSDYKIRVVFETQEAIEHLRQWAKSLQTDGKIVNISSKDRVIGLNYSSLQPKRPEIVQLFETAVDYYNYLPTNMEIAFHLSGLIQGQENSADSKFSGGADINFSDFIVNTDFNFIKKDENYFVRVNKFPSLFFDIDPIKGQWVKISPEDIEGTFGYYFSLINQSQEVKEKESSYLEQIKLFNTLALKNKVLIFKEVPKKETDKKNTRHYSVSLDKEKLPVFYEEAMRAFKQQSKEAIFNFDEKTLAFMKEPAFDNLFDYLNDNTSFDLWLEESTGYPSKMLYSFRLVPDNSVPKLSKTQYSLTTEIEYDNINEKLSVETPSGFIVFDKAYQLISGETDDVYFFNKQYTTVSSMRSSLERFKALAGSYPKSLDDLTKTYGEIRALNTGGQSTSNYLSYVASSTQLVKYVSKDVFTEQPFIYSSNGSTYSLKYQIELPSPENISSSKSYLINTQSKKFIEGQNIATEIYLSKEKSSK